MKICPTCHKTFPDHANFCPRDGTRLHKVNPFAKGFKEGMVIDNRYRLERLLGQGSFAQVWVAEHVIMHQKRALKLLTFDVVDQERMEMSVSRFFREVGAVASIGHENIVRVYEFGEDEKGRPYLVMEYLRGCSLLDHIFDTPFPIDLPRSLEYLRQIAVGMGAAHLQGIVHRDLKSDNIIIHHPRRGGEVLKILDFGVAKFMDNKALANISHAQIFGSPSYMAPEQARGLHLDGRTDIYALGIIAYELFTKEIPFKGSTTEVLLAQVQKPVPDPRDFNPLLPKSVVEFIYTCLEKKPEERYQSMEEVAAQVAKIAGSLS